MRKKTRVQLDAITLASGPVLGNVYLFKAAAGTRETHQPSEAAGDVADATQSSALRWPFARAAHSSRSADAIPQSNTNGEGDSVVAPDDSMPSFLMRGKADDVAEVETPPAISILFAAVCSELREGRHVCRDAIRQASVLCIRHNVGLFGAAGVLAGILLVGGDFDLKANSASASSAGLSVNAGHAPSAMPALISTAAALSARRSQFESLSVAALEPDRDEYSDGSAIGVLETEAAPLAMIDAEPEELMSSSPVETVARAEGDDMGRDEVSAISIPPAAMAPVIAPVVDLPLAPAASSAVYAALAVDVSSQGAFITTANAETGKAGSGTEVNSKTASSKYRVQSRVDRFVRSSNARRIRAAVQKISKPAAETKAAKHTAKVARTQAAPHHPPANRARLKAASAKSEQATQQPMAAVRTLDEAMARQYGSP